jgi:DNA polymerase-3 subunit beta
MQLTIDRRVLAEALSVCGRFVSSRATLPILGDVLLSADDGRLTLKATNLEQAITMHVAATVHLAGMACVPHRIFAEWVNSVAGDDVTLRWMVESAKLNVKCGRFGSNIKCNDVADYPTLPTAPTDGITLDAVAFASMIERTAFAASADNTRPALTGVLCELSPDCLMLAATDGYRLSVAKRQEGVNWYEKRVIIPARALAELGRLLKDDSTVTLALTDNQAFFTAGNAELATQLIDARFPDYNAIIPKTHDTTADVGVSDFSRALRVAQLFARDAANNVRLAFGAEGITIRANAAETGDAEAFAPANIEGPELTIAFNGIYLLDALSHAGADRVELQLTDKNRPGVLVAEGWTHVIMQMAITK